MRRFNWLYLAASLPFLLFAAWGAEYGAFWIYLAPAVLCVVQFFFPTRLGWGLMTVLYGGAVVLYTGLAVADLWRLATGEPLDLFLDADDSGMVPCHARVPVRSSGGTRCLIALVQTGRPAKWTSNITWNWSGRRRGFLSDPILRGTKVASATTSARRRSIPVLYR